MNVDRQGSESAATVDPALEREGSDGFSRVSLEDGVGIRASLLEQRSVVIEERLSVKRLFWSSFVV